MVISVTRPRDSHHRRSFHLSYAVFYPFFAPFFFFRVECTAEWLNLIWQLFVYGFRLGLFIEPPITIRNASPFFFGLLCGEVAHLWHREMFEKLLKYLWQ